MKITKRQLRRIIKEEKSRLLREVSRVDADPWGSPDDPYQMSSSEQRRRPDAGTETMQDAARLLNGILDDWANHPDMNHSVGDDFRMRVADVVDIIEEVVGQQPA